MKTLTLLLLLLTFECDAQFSGPGGFLFSAGPQGASAPPPPSGLSPTNIPGFTTTVYSWYCASSNFTSGGGVATLPNLCSVFTNSNNLNLTNDQVHGSLPTKNAGALNGYDTLSMSGAYLMNNNFSMAQPDEILILAKFVAHADSECRLYTSAYLSGSARQYLDLTFSGANVSASINAGTEIFAVSVPQSVFTNHWTVFDIVFNGASSDARTNRVSWFNGDAGAGAAGSIGINDPGNPGFFDLTEIVSLKGTNFDTTGRSNLFYFWTNRYNLNL